MTLSGTSCVRAVPDFERAMHAYLPLSCNVMFVMIREHDVVFALKYGRVPPILVQAIEYP